jgi:hypothetical protein
MAHSSSSSSSSPSAADLDTKLLDVQWVPFHAPRDPVPLRVVNAPPWATRSFPLVRASAPPPPDVAHPTDPPAVAGEEEEKLPYPDPCGLACLYFAQHYGHPPPATAVTIATSLPPRPRSTTHLELLDARTPTHASLPRRVQSLQERVKS